MRLRSIAGVTPFWSLPSPPARLPRSPFVLDPAFSLWSSPTGLLVCLPFASDPAAYWLCHRAPFGNFSDIWASVSAGAPV